MTSLVMTILGEDRPGVVESLARLVSEQGGNWLESRMAHLAGQFAGIVHVEIEADHANELIRRLEGLGDKGLTVLVHRDDNDNPVAPFAPLKLELVGNDRTGIVQQVTHVLAEHNVNVEAFETERIAAPMTGGQLFRATARLRLPTGLTANMLQSALEAIAHDLMVDIRLHDEK